MIWAQAINRWITAEIVRLIELVAAAIAAWRWGSATRQARRAMTRALSRYSYTRNAYAMASEGVPGYLRYRVVSVREPVQVWNETFESQSGSNSFVWHSLGTEAGTDNSINYWNQVLGTWTYASHVLTSPNTGTGKIVAGHSDWGDCTYQLRFNWVTGSVPVALFHWVDTNNHVEFVADGANVALHKLVAGANTTVSSGANALVTGTWYWFQITSTGTSFTCNIFNDSAGALGAVKGGTISGTISDAAIQNGQVGVYGAAATTSTFGGAFANVCNVTQFLPNFWTPIVTTGEPAFCRSSLQQHDGSWSGSIQIVGSSSGNGSWQQSTTLAATVVNNQTIFAAWIRASAGTANASCDGLTTPNAPTTSTFTLENITGQMTTNPTIQCNFSGAIGVAYFDTMSVVNQGLEITSDLPHLHQSTWQVIGMQPGIPSSAAIGSFTIPLFPPGTEQFAQFWSTHYSKLARWQRVEAYLGYSPDGIGLGSLAFAGFITGIVINYDEGPKMELRGISDVGLANYSRPFPGELTPNVVDSTLIKSYMARNEVGVSDAFNPFVAANYTSTNSPGSGAGSWSSTTDDGQNVITCSTGGGAILIAKQGAAANDNWKTHYVEITGRLKPSSDTTSAGTIGLGFCKNNSNGNDSAFGFVTSFLFNGRYFLNATLKFYSGGASGGSVTYNSVLSNVDDPNGFIPLTVGFLMTNEGNVGGNPTVSLVVNGSIVISQFATGRDPGTATWYPAIFYSAAGTGSGPCYMTNLIHFTRFGADGATPSAAVFAPGTMSTSVNSFGFGVDPGPTFLDVWTRVATREGWYWRYTPQPFVVGARTIGTLDLSADPGVDRSNQCIFRRRDGSLIGLVLDDNADSLASGTSTAGLSSIDGHGLGNYWDISTVQSIGVIHDVTLASTQSDFNTLRKAGQQILANKVKTGSVGHKTAKFLRTPELADTYRELDKVMIDDPEIGINALSARVMAREFVEGRTWEAVVLDQFSWHGEELVN